MHYTYSYYSVANCTYAVQSDVVSDQSTSTVLILNGFPGMLIPDGQL